MAKDFLKVRPRKEESLPSQTRAYQNAAPKNPRRGAAAADGAGAGGAAARSAPPVALSAFAAKQDSAARKLQALFKQRLAQRLRAEAALFATLKLCRESLPSHH